MNRIRQYKSLLPRYGIGGALTVLIGLLMLTSSTLKPKLIDPSYNLPFLNRPIVKPTEVVMVWMDDDSHRELAQPYNASWDRALYARLVERFTTEGARAVVFDILFTDPHPTKPEGDAQFARAIKANGKVALGAEFTFTADGSPTVIRAIDLFFDAAATWGFVQLPADQDFMVRRHLHVPPHPDAENFSSLTWEAAQMLGDPEAQNPENRFTQRWMNYYGPPETPGKKGSGTIPGVSFRVLSPAFRRSGRPCAGRGRGQ